MNDKLLSSKAIFDSIKHIDENGKEYWEARELQKALEYTEWRKFSKVIDKAMKSCKTNNINDLDHFVGADKMVEIGSGAKRKQKDYKLSRYACYLIAMNGDPRKKVIADAQNYFAVQTRKQEITEEEYERLAEENKRLFRRKKMNYREDILDNIESEELGANIFWISQTEAQLRKQGNISEKDANNIHYDIGKNVRDAIIKNGNLPPEKLPTPIKSIKEIENERKGGKIPELSDYMSEKEMMIEESLKENILKNEKLNIAKSLINDGLDVKIVCKATGLTEKELEKLKWNNFLYLLLMI